jgi:hypothetical protein
MVIGVALEVIGAVLLIDGEVRAALTASLLPRL